MGQKLRKSMLYCVRILDLKYQHQFEHLDLNYIYYEVEAKHENEAIEKARELYMKGEKGKFREQLPFLFKLFFVQPL